MNIESNDVWLPRSKLATYLAQVAPLIRRPGFVVACIVVLLSLAAAVAPGLLTQYDPSATNPLAKLSAPSLTHWFGTDELGRDLLSRVIYGAKTSVSASLLAVGIALTVGMFIGAIAGFAGGFWDTVMMRVVDVFLALPALLLALAIITSIGFGTVPIAIAVGAGIVPGFARTIRAEVLRVKAMPYVEAARLAGVSWGTTLLRHVLPNSWGPVLVLAVVDVGAAILATAALSYLGFGASPPEADWGTLIANGRQLLITAPWVSLLPGLYVMLLVFSLNNIARYLEEARK